MLSVGVNIAESVAYPRVGGVHVHVAEKFGEVPVVAFDKHFGMRSPETKKRIRPATVEVTIMVIEIPFVGFPERDGALKVEFTT